MGRAIDHAYRLDEIRGFTIQPLLAMPRVAADISFTLNMLQVLTVH